MKRILLNSLVIIFLLIDIILFVLSQKIPFDTTAPKAQVKQEDDTVIRVARRNYSNSSAFARLIDDYNQNNQDKIRIEMVGLSDSNFQTELNYLMTSSEEPDIMNIDSDWIRTYIEKGWLVDLKPYIREELLGSKTKEVTDYLSAYTLNGAIYVFPTSFTTYRLMYNIDLFQQYGLSAQGPTTFHDIIDSAEHISKMGKDKNVFGLVLPMKDALEGFKKNLEIPCTKSDINYYNPKTGKVDFLVYSDWFYAISDLIYRNIIMPGYESIDMNLALNQFAERNVGMVYVSSEDYPTIQSLYKNEDHWKIILPPDDKETKSDLMMTYSSYYGISRRSKNLDQAIVVWNYLNSKEFNMALFSQGECLPINYKAWDLSADKNLDPMLEAFLPVQQETIYPVYGPEAENIHRINTYLNCLKQKADINDLLLRENYYVRKNPSK